MADELSAVSSIPVEGMLALGQSLDAGSTASGLISASQLGQGAASLNATPTEMRMAQDEMQMRQFAQFKAQELAFNVKTTMEMIPESDVYGIAEAYDSILSSTVAGAQPDEQSRRAQAYLNSTPAYQNIISNMRRMMSRPTVKINPMDPNDNSPQQQRENGLPTTMADKYAQPISMGALLAKAHTDINVARQVLDTTPQSKKKARAEKLGLVWMDGNDSQFGAVPRLLDHQESQAYRARELMVANIMADEGVDRQSALTIHKNREDARMDTESRVQEVMGTLGLSRQAASQHVMYEDKRQAESAKFNMVAQNVNEIMRTMPEKIREDVSTRNAMVAMVYGANSDEAHYLAAFDQFAGDQLTEKQSRLLEIQRRRTELQTKLQMGLNGEGEYAVQAKTFPSFQENFVHDLVETAKLSDVDNATQATKKQGKMQRQAATLLSGGMDTMGEVETWIREDRDLRNAASMVVDKETFLRRGPGLHSTRGTNEKKPALLAADWDRAYQKYRRELDEGDIAFGLNGDLGNAGMTAVALIKIGSQVAQRTDGTKYGKSVAEDLARIRMDMGLPEEPGVNEGSILEKRKSAMAELTTLDQEERDLRNSGTQTPLDKRLGRGLSQNQTNENIHMIDAARRETNPALKVLLYQNAGLSIPDDIARQLTQPSVPTTTQAPGQASFGSVEEAQAAQDRGEIESGQIVLIGGQAMRVD